jgi:isoleucyl-tRNA synthetase
LYTLGADHPRRRSSQTALHHIFRSLVRLLAPFITFTADEAWSFATTGKEYADDSIHLQDWPVAPAEWTAPLLAEVMSARLRDRALVNEAIEPLRSSGKLGKSLDALVTFRGPRPAGEPDLSLSHRESLAELFIVSDVKFAPAAAGDSENALFVQPCADVGYQRCPRCWRWVPAVQPTPHGDVCPRCAEALNS